ncbi:MAG TPA: hypothetical protein VK203_18905 [Nostocaceae cyanobacterium]|nr:hypothetical protein [Nostocaceae cyanobacterium]
MSENFASNHEKLINDLSETEQESIVAGQNIDIPGLGNTDFFFQNTNIQSSATNNLNLGGSDSSSQTTTYNLSQVTIVSSVQFILPSLSTNGLKMNKLLSRLKGLFS